MTIINVMGLPAAQAMAIRPRPIPNRPRTLSEVVKKMISLQLAADFTAQPRAGTGADPVQMTREAMMSRVKGLLTSSALIGHAETDDGKFEIAPEEWDDDRFNAALQYRGTITVWVESGNGLREIPGEGATSYGDFFDLTAVDDGFDRPGDEMVQLATAHSFEVPRRQVTVEPIFYDREIERAFNYGPSAYATTAPKVAPADAVDEPVEAAKPAKRSRGRTAAHLPILDLIQPVLDGEYGGVPKDYPDFKRKLIAAYKGVITDRTLGTPPYARVPEAYDDWAKANGAPKRATR